MSTSIDTGTVATSSRELQAAHAVLMIRPESFASNPETLDSNRFQSAAVSRASHAGAVGSAAGQRGAAASCASHARAVASRAGQRGAAAPPREIQLRAQQEFDALAARLAECDVRVHAFAGQSGMAAPDEVFPNNWLSLHADGSAVIYPMLAPSRRVERRLELLDALRREGYRIDRVIDLTSLEARGEFLEGTGSLVLDRVARIAYSGLSARTHRKALAEFGRQLDYEVAAFAAFDRGGHAIYHTNVLMSVGTEFAVICSAAIRDRTEREHVLARLRASGREIVDIGFDQMHAFAGNLLELRTRSGAVIALSATAHAALYPTQIQTLCNHGELVTADIATIEHYGGGSVRCMLAEVHLPTRSSATDGHPP